MSLPRSKRSRFLAIIAAVLGAGALSATAACAPPRTSAATQPSGPQAFDPAASDPKALALADEVLAAVGGEAAWKAAKELRWTSTVLIDGKPKLIVKHSWDRWNGRDQFRREPQEGRASGVLAMYELYSDVGSARVIDAGGKTRDASSEDQDGIIKEARAHWESDSYLLTMPFKLKDPGVNLKYVEERPETGGDAAVMKFDVLKVTFASGVGASPGDTYYVIVDKATHLIDSVEHVESGRKDEERVGYKWSEWTEVGGLKFATKRQNIGYAAEQIQFSDIKVAPEPEEELYVPVVTP
jgi:hypothetical protein